MATEKWIKTAHKGLRYYEHPTRKHGKRKDRYYQIRFKVAGKDYGYGVGWWSDGIPEEARQIDSSMGFEEYCLSQLRLFKTNKKAGSGVMSPKDKRKAVGDRLMEEGRAKEEEAKAARTFEDYCSKIYLPWCDQNKRPNSLRSEKTLLRIWINPLIGKIPMTDVSQIHLERLKKRMFDKGRAPKTVNLALAVVRQIFNYAKQRRDYNGDNPVSGVKKPKVENAKLRYLSPHEIDTLLNALAEKSQTVHDQSLLAVSSGMRFSEVANLTWQDVNFETRSLSIRDSKTGSRTVFINDSVEALLRKLRMASTGPLVFPDEKGGVQAAPSKTFQRVSDELFNRGVSDRRLRVSFHNLRHTFGSLVYQQTGDIYLTGKALGHKTLTMAMRYAKQSEPKLRAAFETMGAIVESGKAKPSGIIELKR